MHSFLSLKGWVFVVEPWNWDWPFPTLSLRNSTIQGNAHGVVTRHYNQPTNEWLDIFSRYRWETIRMYGLQLRSNLYEAVHALSITRYNVLYMPTFEELQRALRIAEIHYTVEACHFEGNGGGILAEHNHVEFSNNVWIWQITGDRFEKNLGGGYMIELPRVWNQAYCFVAMAFSLPACAVCFFKLKQFRFRFFR